MVRDQRWCRPTLVTVLSITIVMVPTLLRASQAEEIAFEVPSGRVTLHPPVAIEDVSAYRDGGTVAVRLKDRDGVILDLCLDGRMRPQREARKPYHLFLGGRHPTDPHTRKVPVGGAEEKTILALLQEATISPGSAEAQPEQAAVVEYRNRILEKVFQTLQAR